MGTSSQLASPLTSTRIEKVLVDFNLPTEKMAYSWDNRVKFVVRFMYDIDNNGYLDKNDFECLALRNSLIECRGDYDDKNYAKNKEIMSNLWNEIAALADFNKDSQVSVEEFKQAIQKNCSGKSYGEFPSAFKSFIANNFKTIDVDVKEIDDGYDHLLSDEDKKAGGISLERYQELYAQFISNPDEKCNAVYLFGPLSEV